MLSLILATRVSVRNIVIVWFVIAAVVGFPIIWICKAVGVDEDKGLFGNEGAVRAVRVRG